jgi:hypothetical protein
LKGNAARPDGILTGTHLFNYVRDNVTRAHKDQVPIFGYLAGSGSGEFVFHLQTREETPPDTRRALLSPTLSGQITGVRELEALAVSADADTSYNARTELKQISRDVTRPEAVRLAAKVAIEVAIPILEAEQREWVRGPLYNPADSSTFDRILAGLEYNGNNNYYRNNDTIAVVAEYGVAAFGAIPAAAKRRFARALVHAATDGAYGPQDFLRNAARLPDDWLEHIVAETASAFQERMNNWWARDSMAWLFAPLVAWIGRGKSFPPAWDHWLEAAADSEEPNKYIPMDAATRQGIQTTLREISESLGDRRPYDSERITRLLARL